MARDKAATKAMVENLKNEIKQLNEQLGTSLSYSKISKSINNIFKMNADGRDAAIMAYELALRNEVADHVMTARSTFWSASKLAAKNMETPLMNCSATHVSKAVRKFIRSFCEIKEEGYIDAHPYTQENAKELCDWGLAAVRSRTFYSESPKYMKAWDAECFAQEIKNLDEHFRDPKTGALKFTFQNEYAGGKARKDIIAADAYRKMTHLKGELAKHGFFWRLFHSKTVAAWRGYIAKAEDTLNAIGFVESEHKDKALEVLKATMATPHDIDEEAIKGEYEVATKALDAKKVKELTVARDLLAKGNALDKNPETSIYSKLEHFFEKYDFRKEFEKKQPYFSFDNAAEEYDKRRNLGAMKDCASSCMLLSFAHAFNYAVKNGKEVNVAELMNDARKIATIVMEHYMPSAAIEELKNLDKPLYLFGFGEDRALYPVNKLEKFGYEVSDPAAEGGVRKVFPDREVMEKLKADIKAVLADWNADPAKLLREDAGATVSEEREQIVVDLNEKVADQNTGLDKAAEEIAPKVEEVKAQEEIAPKSV